MLSFKELAAGMQHGSAAMHDPARPGWEWNQLESGMSKPSAAKRLAGKLPGTFVVRPSQDAYAAITMVNGA